MILNISEYILYKLYTILNICAYIHMGVSKNSGTPKSSILMGFPLETIHFGVPPFTETLIYFDMNMNIGKRQPLRGCTIDSKISAFFLVWGNEWQKVWPLNSQLPLKFSLNFRVTCFFCGWNTWYFFSPPTFGEHFNGEFQLSQDVFQGPTHWLFTFVDSTVIHNG